MKTVLLSTLLSMACMSVIAQPTPFVGCPNNNVAVLRAGTNSTNTNPLSIYNINTVTGTPTLLSGPILDPANTANNLQVNGLGLSTTDGFLYGLNSSSVTIPTPFYRVGANAVAEQIGNMPGPALSGAENLALVNSASGEMDRTSNYYFTGGTGVANFSTFTFAFTRLFIGKLASTNTLAPGTGLLTPTYTQITTTDPNCTDYYNSLTAPVSLATINNAANTGLRDLVFDVKTGKIFSYVTYPNPSNPSTFMGMMIKIDPNSGVLTAVAPPVVLPFASASNEVAGTLLDKDGIFLILFTDGTIYRANTIAPGTFNGSIGSLNASTGFPNPLRGDMASCGGSLNTGGPLPVILNYFNAFAQGNNVILKWETSSEINASKFVIERSFDGTNWAAIHTINSAGNSGIPLQYRYDDINVPAKTIFYRLKFVDIDGVVTYSNIKKLSLNAAAVSLSFYPNPVTDVLYVESTMPFSNAVTVKISDLSGRVQSVSFVKNDVNKLKVNTATLAAGVYFLQIDNGGNKSTQKIIKQ